MPLVITGANYRGYCVPEGLRTEFRHLPHETFTPKLSCLERGLPTEDEDWWAELMQYPFLFWKSFLVQSLADKLFPWCWFLICGGVCLTSILENRCRDAISSKKSNACREFSSSQTLNYSFASCAMTSGPWPTTAAYFLWLTAVIPQLSCSVLLLGCRFGYQGGKQSFLIPILALHTSNCFKSTIWCSP